MTKCWIEGPLESRLKSGELTQAIKAKALPYAYLARDVYSYNMGKKGRPADPKLNWLEVLATPEERKTFVIFETLRIALARLAGFNAMLYQFPGGGHVLSFEGTHGEIKNPRDFAKFMQDMLLANIPAGLSVVNTLERFLPFGIFGRILNPTRAPSTQYEMAELVARVVLDKFGGDVVLTGHSLGGGLAQYASMKTGLRAVIFNSAGIGFDPFAKEYAANIAHFKSVGGVMNPFITDGTGPFSRHLGSEFVVGRGGHGMDEVIRLLMVQTSMAA